MEAKLSAMDYNRRLRLKPDLTIDIKGLYTSIERPSLKYRFVSAIETLLVLSICVAEFVAPESSAFDTLRDESSSYI